MKKTILLKVAFNLLLLSVCVCFGHLNASAQNSSPKTQLLMEPKGAFVTSDVAITVLMNQMLTLKSEYGALEPGTNEYDLIEWKYAYYREVRSHIRTGKTVSQAIGKAGEMYVTNPAYSRVTEPQRIANRNAVIDLLKA